MYFMWIVLILLRFWLFQVMFSWSEQRNHTQLPAFRCNEQVLQCEKFSQFTCRMDMLNKIATILNFLGQIQTCYCTIKMRIILRQMNCVKWDYFHFWHIVEAYSKQWQLFWMNCTYSWANQNFHTHFRTYYCTWSVISFEINQVFIRPSSEMLSPVSGVQTVYSKPVLTISSYMYILSANCSCSYFKWR